MNAHSIKVALCRLTERLFPQGCACCGNVIYKADDPFYGLCTECRERLFAEVRESKNRCSVCGKPLISETETCLACRRGPVRSFDKVITLFPYVGNYQKILRAYKFNSRRVVGHFFAECLLSASMAEEFRPEGEDLRKIGPRTIVRASYPVWIPVPPRPGKIKKAGWDQVEYLARLLERKKVPVYRCLKRLSSESQKILDRERRRLNLKGKIILKEKFAVPDTALLFDDVYTTGSTMDACAETLKAGGVKTVYGICLFYD
jgi:ComF family protein